MVAVRSQNGNGTAEEKSSVMQENGRSSSEKRWRQASIRTSQNVTRKEALKKQKLNRQTWEL